MGYYIRSFMMKRVGAALAVALIQGGGKPRPYSEGVMFLII